MCIIGFRMCLHIADRKAATSKRFGQHRERKATRVSGDDVEFSIPTSDELFDLLMRDGPVVAQVPGASLTLPAQDGRARSVTAFVKSCVSS